MMVFVTARRSYDLPLISMKLVMAPNVDNADDDNADYVSQADYGFDVDVDDIDGCAADDGQNKPYGACFWRR